MPLRSEVVVSDMFSAWLSARRENRELRNGARQPIAARGLMLLLLCHFWLPRMDSNHEKRFQRPLCYHYTTGQTEGRKVANFGTGAREWWQGSKVEGRRSK